MANDSWVWNLLSKIILFARRSIEENNALASICMFVPWFSKLFPRLSGMKEMNKHLGPLWSFFERHIYEHKSTYIQGQIRDFLDAYINEIEDTKDPDSSFYKDVGGKKPEI